jgi:tetratricopeptide (TPR) repeat protein
MKPPAWASACFLVVAAATAQEPSAKDLRALLHADVKQYAHDGRLVAAWTFAGADQLDGFKRQDEKAIKVVPGEGLSLTFVQGGRAMCLFKELEFEQPCKIGLEVRPETAAGGFELSMFDPAAPQARLLFGLNVVVPRGAIDLIARMENGAVKGVPKSRVSSIVAGAWTPVTIDYRGDKATLTIAKAEPFVLESMQLKRFAIIFGAAAGKASIRNLSLDTQVNRDSIRKLFRSVTAKTESRPKATNLGAMNDRVWEKVDEEFGGMTMSDDVSAQIDALPADAKRAIETGLAADGKDRGKAARESFEAAVKAAPASAVVQWLAGCACMEDSAPLRASQYLEKAVTLDPKLAPAWIRLGEVRGGLGEHAKADDAFDKAEALDPADPCPAVLRARARFERGDLPGARKSVERALPKRPESEALKLLVQFLDRLSARPNWKNPFKKETPLYVVETTISSKAAADMAQRLVVYRRYLEKAFPLQLKEAPPPSRVWIFDSEDEYHQFASTLATGMDGSLGLFHRLNKTLLLTSKVSAETTQHILFHEGFHQYLDLAVSQAPIWMNEGLAEYFGSTTFDVTGKPAEGGMVAMRLPDLRGPLVPIDKLIRMPPGVYMHPQNASRHYAQSWALVHYLKQGGNASATRLFDLYCAAIIAGRSHADAYLMSFGRDGGGELAGIETDFTNYVKTRLLGGR